MKIQMVSVARHTAKVRFLNTGFSAAVNALSVFLHPLSNLSQPFDRLLRDISPGVRADIQKQVSTLRYALDQLFDQHRCRFEEVVVGTITPVIVHRDAGFPGDIVSIYILDAIRRNHLLRAHKVAVVRGRISGRQRTVALSAHLETVVDDDIRLELPHHIDQLRRFPCFAAQRIVGKVKPQHIELSVVCADLAYLIVHVGQVTVEIAVIVFVCRVVPHRVVPVAVMWEIVVEPVEQGEIQTDLQSFCADGINILCNEVAAAFRVGGFEISILAVEEAESIVMLGSQNHVFHTGLFRRLGPFPRLEINGIELLKIFHVIFFRNLLGTPHPFSARRDGVKPPVDKHAETGVAVPLHPPVIGFSVKFVHRFASSCFSFILVMIQSTISHGSESLRQADIRNPLGCLIRVKADIRNPLRCLIRLNLNFHPFSLFEADRCKDKP